MATSAKRIAGGEGWSVDDVACTAGPGDRRFEERHHAFCIAAVLEGSFQYRSSKGSALLAPGALLLGNAGECFECGHDHGVGDRCLSFSYSGELAAELGIGSGGLFRQPRLPPMPRLLPLVAAGHCASEHGGLTALEEVAFLLLDAVVAISRDPDVPPRAPSSRDERRISEAVRLIEARADEAMSLAGLAASAGMSRFHFLRTFRQVVGATPHQYLLQTRLRRAALRLHQGEGPIAAIAFDCGFGDLATFNRLFRRVLGQTPSAFRASRSR